MAKPESSNQKNVAGSGQNQRCHFEEIHDEYEADYEDNFALHYKTNLFLNRIAEALHGHVPLDGKVLEVAAGSGRNLQELRRLINRDDVQFWATDISRKAVEALGKLHGEARTFAADFTDPNLDLEQQFDAIVIIGGVHHMVRALDTVFENVAKSLKRGGILIFVEPNALFFNRLRTFWYRRDRFFDADDEAALNHDQLKATYGASYYVGEAQYFGGLGFYLVLQAMVLRIPKLIKQIVYRPLTVLDVLYSAVSTPKLSPAFIATWKLRSCSTMSNQRPESTNRD